jgi:hypothetical protein
MIKVCTTKDLFCISTLNDPAKDKHAKGSVDTYNSASMLGECFGVNFWGHLKATRYILSKYIEYVPARKPLSLKSCILVFTKTKILQGKETVI